MTPTSAAERLVYVAKLLYGERWSGAMSDALKIDQRTLQRIANGQMTLRKDHPLWNDVRALLDERVREITIVDSEIAKEYKWTKRATDPVRSRNTSKSAAGHSRS